MKVCIGVPHGGSVKGRLMTDVLRAMFTNLHAVSFLWADTEGTLGPRNRWLAAKQAVQAECDYLWLIDNDMAIPPEALPRLMAADKEIIGAAYNYRSVYPTTTTVKMLNESGEIIIPDYTTFPAEPFICHALGSGCQLIKVSALKRIPQPWFALSWGEDGDLNRTDDVWFCEQAKKVGIETWCDASLDVRHIGDHLF